MLTLRSRELRALGAGLCVVAAVLTGCTTDGTGSSGSGSSSGTSAVNPAVLGTARSATGPQLKVGFMTDGATASYDDTPEISAAQAAATYVNQYLGGIGKQGYKLSVDVCSSNGTPSGATNCGNKFLADGVPVVLWNLSAQGQALYDVLSKAGTPEFINGSSDAGPLTGNHAFIVENQLAVSFAGPAVLAGRAKAKHSAIFVMDVPSAADPAKQLFPKMFAQAGVPSVDVVTIPPGTPDMSAQVQAQINKGMDFLYVIGDATFCTTLLRATTSLDYTGKTALLQNCIATNGGATALPDGYTGMDAMMAAVTSTSDPDVQTYQAAMNKWGNGVDPFKNPNIPGGFTIVVNFARAMKNFDAQPSPQTIEAALKSMPRQPLFFGGGMTFQCDGTQVKSSPGLCSMGALEGTLEQDGQVQGKPVLLDTSAILG